MRRRKQNIVQDGRHRELLPSGLDKGTGRIPHPGEMIRVVRTTLRMSQEQLARRSRFPQAHIARIEAGRVDLQWKSIYRLLFAMRCLPVLKVRPLGSLERILESQIVRTVRRRQAQFLEEYPEERQSPEIAQQEEREFIGEMRARRTSEIWDIEDEPRGTIS